MGPVIYASGFTFCDQCRGVLSGRCDCVLHQDGVDVSKCVAHRGIGHAGGGCKCPSEQSALSDMFYILDSRDVVGNCVSWWRPDGNGYTCDLAEAGLYSREQAFGKRETDIPIPRELAEAFVVKHVRSDRIRDIIDVVGYTRTLTRTGAARDRWWARQRERIAMALAAKGQGGR